MGGVAHDPEQCSLCETRRISAQIAAAKAANPRFEITDAGRAELAEYDTDEDYRYGPPEARGCALGIAVCVIVSGLGWWALHALYVWVTR